MIVYERYTTIEKKKVYTLESRFNEGPEGKEGGALSDVEVEQYHKNRTGSASVVLNFLDKWGYVFQRCQKNRRINGYHEKKIWAYWGNKIRCLKSVNVKKYRNFVHCSSYGPDCLHLDTI